MAESGLNIVLYQPEIAGNVGTVARTCAVLGCTLHLVRPLGFRLGDPSMKRAAMDYLEGVDVVVHDAWQDFKKALPSKARVFATGSGGQEIYSRVQYHAGDFLLFGPESSGLPKELLHEHTSIKIPMPHGGRSLNLAISVGIVAFEAAKQITNNWQK